jgi:tetratricopeptide (TPR) repeat protein
MSDPSRIDMLKQFLAENPGDAFARYGLAMEYSRLGQIDTALAEYKKLLELNPDYTAGYQMAAQMLAAAGRTGEARKMFADGIAAAQRAGNVHARTEMEGMLAELG